MKHQLIWDKTKRAITALCVMLTAHVYASETDDVRQQQRYVVTGHQTREIELRVTPEIRASLPRYCFGHWHNPWRMNRYYCHPGCRGGEMQIVQTQRVDVIRDVWQGCEELERYVSLNQAERIKEEAIVVHETRVISGFPITHDSWDKTVTYVLSKEAFHDYSANIR